MHLDSGFRSTIRDLVARLHASVRVSALCVLHCALIHTPPLRAKPHSRGQDQDLFLPLAKIRTCFAWPRSGLVAFWPRSGLISAKAGLHIKSGSWPAWQNKSGSWPGRRPRSGLKKMSPDLGQEALAKIRTHFRCFFGANTGPRGRARQVRILPMGAGQDPDLKK